MAGPPHHFMPNMNQPNRNQFANTMQNQMSNAMQNQMQGMQGSQLGQMGMQMSSAMGNQLNNPMQHNLSNQMTLASQLNNLANANMNQGGQLNALYMNNANQMQQQQQQMHVNQMQQQQMGMQHHSTMQQVQTVQQQQQQIAPTPTPTPPTQQQPTQQQPQQQQQQQREFNTASLCRIGQETVQDIVSRTQEVFQYLKQIQPPNGTPQGAAQSNEKKVKVQEQLRTLRLLFKRLRMIYEKCNENCQIQGMEYTHIESLIPYKDEVDPKHDEKKNTEAYRSSCEEMKEIMEQVVAKNKQLKDVVDILRRIIWEINTMLTMRRS